ncbi:MAG: RNA polymerase sigma factor [Acidobacteria bacterium]|nr:RNA polymerase sigma factor [Acidobacteriota bacterium]
MVPLGPSAAGEDAAALPARDAASDYRRLLAALASRAKWLGSLDPEGAAQETLKRSLENASSQPAVEYYFSQDLPAALPPPVWPLDQLLAWLHGVLRYVVREERGRVRYSREVPIGGIGPDPADPTPDQLHSLIQEEMEGIVADCFPMLEREYRAVLKMRAQGMKYGEIATRMGVNENTVATWVSRGIRDLAQRVRKRMGGGWR